jgi:hypothetical protein
MPEMDYDMSMKTDDGITADIQAYEKMLPSLENNVGKWILIYQEKLVGTFESSEDAATEAVERYGRGPFLIRQVGAPPIILAASVMYVPV